MLFHMLPNASAFDLGETTPIFEEIASAWFRSNRPVPVSWESDTGSHPVVPPSTTTPAADTTDPNGVTRTGPSDGRTGPSDGRADGWGQSDRSPVGTPADGWPSVGRPAPGDVLADAGADTPPSTRPAAPSAVPPSGYAVAVRTCGRRAAVGAPTRIDTCLPGRPARRTARRTPPRRRRLLASPSPPPRTSPPRPTRDGSPRAARSPTALTSSPRPVCPSAGPAPGSSPAVPGRRY